MATVTLYDRDGNSFDFAAADFAQRGHQEQVTAYGETDQRFIISLLGNALNTSAAFIANSTTSLTIGTGSKSLTVEKNKPFFVGSYVRIEEDGTPANYMAGDVTAYNTSTGALTVNVTDTGGSGTSSDWKLLAQGKEGPKGDQGDSGTSDFDWTLQSSAYTASKDDRVLADTSGAAFTVTLPASPANGHSVWVADHANTWATNNLTVNGNGTNIEGAANFTADVDGGAFELVYNSTEWKVRFSTGR